MHMVLRACGLSTKNSSHWDKSSSCVETGGLYICRTIKVKFSNLLLVQSQVYRSAIHGH